VRDTVQTRSELQSDGAPAKSYLADAETEIGLRRNHRLGEERFIELGRFGMLEPAQRHAFVVEPDAVRELRPWKGVRLLDVVQELDQFVGTRANLRHGRGLFDRIEIVAHKVDAATLWRHHAIEVREIAHEQGFRGGGLGIEAGIGHRLPAAGLVARVDDFMAEALQEFEGRDPNSPRADVPAKIKKRVRYFAAGSAK
jgi:hypothetical protein